MRFDEELTTSESKRLIDDLAEFNVPVILFSGGEPLLREDILELGSHAVKQGIRAVLSTNGTLITPQMAKQIKDSGFSYVGISLDGLEETNDLLRGVKGAFIKALTGIHNCKQEGIKAGIRFTLQRQNYRDLENILNMTNKEDISRCCIYHLVYSGRGNILLGEALSIQETRKAVDLIFRKTIELCKMAPHKEILTVDNHTDGVYLYLELQRKDPLKAEKALEMLKRNGGNRSGSGIACIDEKGNVHPDQFLRNINLGNVRERKFSDIWMDNPHPLLNSLRNRKKFLKGRCATCKYLDICNGNLRARAEAVYGDLWSQDPACYLADEEIR